MRKQFATLRWYRYWVDALSPSPHTAHFHPKPKPQFKVLVVVVVMPTSVFLCKWNVTFFLMRLIPARIDYISTQSHVS